MNGVLKKFKKLEIDLKHLKNEFGNDLYNVSGVKSEKICAKDVCFVIEQYLSNQISMSTLLDWVNTIWFTELYVYSAAEENTIASVMTILETIDEDGVLISKDDFAHMLECLKGNIPYEKNY